MTILQKEERTHLCTDTMKEDHVMTEAEIEVMQLQAKKHLDFQLVSEGRKSQGRILS